MAKLTYRITTSLLRQLGMHPPLTQEPEVAPVIGLPVQYLNIITANGEKLAPALVPAQGWVGGEVGGQVTAANIPTFQVHARAGGVWIEHLSMAFFTITGEQSMPHVVFWRVTDTDPIGVANRDATWKSDYTVWNESAFEVFSSQVLAGHAADVMDDLVVDSPCIEMSAARHWDGVMAGMSMLPGSTYVPPGKWFTMQIEATGATSKAYCIRARLREHPVSATPT